MVRGWVLVAFCVLCCAAAVDARRQHRRRKSSDALPKVSQYVMRGARVPHGAQEFESSDEAYAVWAKDMTAWCQGAIERHSHERCMQLERTLALGRAAIHGQFLSEQNKQNQVAVDVKESVDKIEFDDFGQPIKPTSDHLMADYRTAYGNFLHKHPKVITRSQRMCAAFCAGRENADDALKANPSLLIDRGFVEAFFYAAGSALPLLGKQAKFVKGDSCANDCDTTLGVQCTAICEAKHLDTPAEDDAAEKVTVLNSKSITEAYKKNGCNAHAEFKSVLDRMTGESAQLDCASGNVYYDQLSEAFRAYEGPIVTGVVSKATGDGKICPLVFEHGEFTISKAPECRFPGNPPLLVTVGKLIAAGGYGRVHAVTYKKGGNNVPAVLKLLRNEDNSYKDEVASFELVESKKFPNTVKRVAGGSACEPLSAEGLELLTLPFCYIVLEDSGAPILDQLFKEDKTIDLKLYWKALHSVLTAVAAYSDQDMVHGDLKPPNILAKDDGTVTVIDLGTMRVVPVDKDGVATWVKKPYTAGFGDELPSDPIQHSVAERPIYYYDMRSTARTFCSLLFKSERCVDQCGCDGGKSWEYTDELAEDQDLKRAVPDQATRQLLMQFLADMWNTKITPEAAAVDVVLPHLE
eukprot:gnl/Spiro4/2988_TR1466_c0_g1_i1.p1 gnl/Spiro4/2988_TR1466_c0_g1~~gnl/Spiro4/2988_TR1466_c0_g1_i1.p1  ORF type:complete len:645 (-),score=152.25 gnl/Spiro4/2988_TR1466_c0_g1_i1:60-1967(-)